MPLLRHSFRTVLAGFVGLVLLGLTGPAWAHSLAPGAAPGVPPEALRYRARLIREVHFYWSLGTSAAMFFAQVHQESRFRATAQSRFASGLAQFTPPTAAGVQSLYPSDLKTLCAERGGCPLDPAWALRALVLWDRRLWEARAFATGDERLAFMLADYNGGAGWINRERTFCRNSGGCDPDVYFNSVQLACGRSTPFRADWACRENGHYPEVILRTWRPLYARWLPGL